MKRYTQGSIGMREVSFGEWVEYEEVADEIERLRSENTQLQKERDRLLVLATKWCDKNHQDWTEILNLVGKVAK